MSSAVSDADGDVVRCRWAESAQNECAAVCQVFPATLNRVGEIVSNSANTFLAVLFLLAGMPG